MNPSESYMQDLFDSNDWAMKTIQDYSQGQLREDFYRVSSWYFTGQPFSRYEQDLLALVSFHFMRLKHGYKVCNMHCLYCRMVG